MTLAALLGGAVWLGAPDGVSRAATAALAAGSVAMVIAGLALRLPVLVAPAAALLGVGYTVARVADGGAVDLHAPLLASGLLLTCELAYWAHELRTTSPDEPGMAPRHVAWLALLGIGAYLTGLAVLALTDLVRVEGVAIEALGAAAAAAVIAGLVLVARAGQRAA